MSSSSCCFILLRQLLLLGPGSWLSLAASSPRGIAAARSRGNAPQQQHQASPSSSSASSSPADLSEGMKKITLQQDELEPTTPSARTTSSPSEGQPQAQHPHLVDDIVSALRLGEWGRAQEHAQRVHEVRRAADKSHIVQTVQDVVSDTKQAEELLLYLNRQYSLPDALNCSSRWAQNSTAVVLQVRFAKSWTGPSGHWGQRYSTKGGEGLIEQNAEGINDLLKLHFNSSTNAFAMEIVGQIGTKRWRFQVPETVLFAEVTEKVQHEISFRNAKGSMQMSKGAQLPELRVYFLKKIRGFYWSRFAADPETSLEWTETSTTTTTSTTTSTTPPEAAPTKKGKGKKKKKKIAEGAAVAGTSTASSGSTAAPRWQISLLDAEEQNAAIEGARKLDADARVAQNSAITCARPSWGGGATIDAGGAKKYCPATDACVSSCERECSSAPAEDATGTDNKVCRRRTAPTAVNCAAALFTDHDLAKGRTAGTIALDGVVAEADIWQLEKMDVSLAGGVEGAADADRETLLSLDAQTQALSGLRYYEAAPSAAVDENEQNGAAAASSSASAKRSPQALSVPPYVSKIGVVFSAASDSAVVPSTASDEDEKALRLRFFFSSGGAASAPLQVVTCGRIVARDRVLLEDVVAEVKPFTDANPNAGLVSGELKLQLSDPRSTSGVHVYFARAGIGETVKVAPELPDPSESTSPSPCGDEIRAMHRVAVDGAPVSVLPALRLEFGSSSGRAGGGGKGKLRGVSCSGGRVELEDVESGPFGQKNGLTTWRLRDLRFPAGTNQLISVPYRGDVEGVRERVVQIQDSQKPKRLAAVVMTEDEYLVPGVVSVGFTPSFRDNSATGIAVYEAFNCNKARNSTASSSDVAPSGTDVSQDHDYAAGELQSRSKEEVEFLEGMTHHCKAYEARVQSGELERLQQGASASPGKNLSHADREKRKALELYRSHGLLQVRAVAQEGTARLQDEEVGNINIQRNKAARQKLSLATSSHRGPVRYAGRNVDAFLVFAVNDVGESDEWFIKTGVEDKVMTQLERNSRKDYPDNELRRYLRHAEDLYVEKSKHFPNAETVEAMRELIKFVGRDEELYRLSVTVEEDEAGAKNAAMRREL